MLVLQIILADEIRKVKREPQFDQMLAGLWIQLAPLWGLPRNHSEAFASVIRVSDRETPTLNGVIENFSRATIL